MIIKNIYEENYKNICNCHNGKGLAKVRVIFEKEFISNISFLHYTTLSPNTSIGYHKHDDSEEIYIVLKGSGIITVDNKTQNVKKGDVVLTQKGSSHGLVNCSACDLDILVIEGKQSE